jgi:small subunit ribosomal protein S8
MSMSDPIGDMLTRIRNAIQAGQPSVDVPASRLKEEVCALLKREGFIQDYALTEDRKSVG